MAYIKQKWIIFPGLALVCLLLILFNAIQYHGVVHTPAQNEVTTTEKKLNTSYHVRPLLFEKNAGQTNEAVKYTSRGEGYTLYLTTDEFVFALTGGNSNAGSNSILSLSFEGANINSTVTGVEELAEKRNYIIGNQPSEWHTDIPTYARVKYEDIYPGIDLVSYGSEGLLEYDFIVAPGVDPDVIQLAVRGADHIRLDEGGNLVIHTRSGNLVQKAPMVYQEVDGLHRSVKGKYVVYEQQISVPGPAARVAQPSLQTVSFQVAEYNHDLPLIIDPAITYSSYLGGTNLDQINDITIDGQDNVYITGATMSADFPSTNGLYTTHNDSNGVNLDVFVTKLNSAGQIEFSTFLGSGNGVTGSDDEGLGIAVNSGNIYITGYTNISTSAFPTTTGAYDISHNGVSDVFVTEINSTGDTLLYSTLVGGSSGDEGHAISVDASGKIYVTGRTFSDTDFPVVNAYQTTGDGNTNTADAFVIKLSPDGNSSSDLFYSTYIGGNNNDEANAIAVDSIGNAYITGVTNSINYPVKSALPGLSVLTGTGSAFVTRLNATGNTLGYSTYLGGNGDDSGQGLALDSSSNVYIVGSTDSTDFPVTTYAYDKFVSGTDAFVAKLSVSGSSLSYATYLGGGGSEAGYDIVVDSIGQVLISGETSSGNFPVTSNAAQPFYLGGEDAFVAQLNSSGSTLVFASYLGGSGNDRGLAIAQDSVGSIIMGGWTASSDVPVTGTAAQGSYNGVRDGFLLRLGPFADLALTLTDDEPLILGGLLTYTVTIINNGPDSATNVVVTDTLPNDINVSYFAASQGCNNSSGVVTCTLGTLSNGGSKSFQIQVVVNTTDIITNSATVAANEPDEPSDNSRSVDSQADNPGGITDPTPPDDKPPTIIISDGSSSSASGDGGGGVSGPIELLLSTYLLIPLVPGSRKRCANIKG